MWPDNRVLDLFGIESPIIQAPMTGSASSDMVVAVSEAGGLGSLACALLSVEQARSKHIDAGGGAGRANGEHSGQ